MPGSLSRDSRPTMLLPMLLSLGLTARADDLTVEFAGALHTHAFAAPRIGSAQAPRSFMMVTAQAEAEVRGDRFGVRGRIGIGGAMFAIDLPPRLAIDGAVLLLGHSPPINPGGSRYYGLELGLGRVFAHTRIYGGPALGTSRRWQVGMLEGIAGIRFTAGLAYELASRNDWATLNPGPTLGGQIGLALTFAPVE